MATYIHTNIQRYIHTYIHTYIHSHFSWTFLSKGERCMWLSLCEAPNQTEQHNGQPQHRETSRPTHKGVEFKWEDTHQAALERLKCSLTSEEVMAYFHPSKRSLLFGNASPVGLGAVLTQGGKKREQLSIDFCEVARHYVLVVVDDHSRFPETEVEHSTSSKAVIHKLDRVWRTPSSKDRQWTCCCTKWKKSWPCNRAQKRCSPET